MKMAHGVLLSEAAGKPFPHSYLPPSPNFYTGGPVVATRANLPHWNKDNTASFATFRLADSLPREKLLSLEEARCAWRTAHPQPWDEATTREYYASFDERLQEWLDCGWGSCVLREASNRLIVEDALWHFAGSRYALYAYVVMPNHVHVLFMPTESNTLSAVVAGWKQHTAHEIHATHGGVGPLWQKESFDTLVRSDRHFKTILGYIKRNDPE